MAHSDFWGDLLRNLIFWASRAVCGDVVVRVVVGVVVGHSFCKTSEVNSDHTLPVYIVKHDTLDTAKVMVGVSIALGVLVRVLPGGLP